MMDKITERIKLVADYEYTIFRPFLVTVIGGLCFGYSLYSNSNILGLVSGLCFGVLWSPYLKIWKKSTEKDQFVLKHLFENSPLSPWIRMFEKRGVLWAFGIITMLVLVMLIIAGGTDLK